MANNKDWHLFDNTNEFLKWIENEHRFSKKVSLEKMAFLCKLFGNPQDKITTIHVTGTNGKGSVVSYLYNIFHEAGLNVGCYTSPYITRFNERICYNGIMISNTDILRIANQIIKHYDEIYEAGFEKPSFFEFITLLAFIYYAEIVELDVAIIEVGIGGKLDSTNVIKPILSIVTNIAYDHMNVLGNTLTEILDNKLGIVKTGVPAIIGVNTKELIDQANEYALSTNSEMTFPLTEKPDITSMSITGSEFSTKSCSNVIIKMPGFHQIENAMVAIAGIDALNKRNFPNNHSKRLTSKLPINDVILKRGLEKTTWLGRFEKIVDDPLIIIDGAHNIDGITRILEFVKTLDYRSKRCIFACSDNKEKLKMVTEVDKCFDEVIYTAFSYKRHSDALELFEMSNHENKIINNDIDDIIDYVYEKPMALNLFIGSLYFVSEIRPKLKAKEQLK